MWSHYLIRRLSVQMALVWNFGWGRAMRRVYGVSMENTLVFGDAKKTEYWTDANQHREYRAGLRRLLQDKNFLRLFHKQAQVFLEGVLADFKSKFRQGFDSATDQELAILYKKFLFPSMTGFFVRMWTVFNLGEQADLAVREKLKQFVPENKVDEYLLKLSRSARPNDVMSERLDLLKLAAVRKKATKKRWEILMEKHVAKYRHIPVYDFDHQPYTKKHFLSELKKIKAPQKELARMQNIFRKSRQDMRQVIANIHPDTELTLLLNFLRENVFLRDYRDMLRQKLNLELKTFYAQAGKRLGLDIFEVGMLTRTEMIEYLSTSKIFPKQEIKKRKRAFLLIQKSDVARIFSGERARRKFKTEIPVGRDAYLKELHGTVGSKGEPVSGRAVVVYTNRDLYKVKQGQIMFTGMTRQDFVPYLRKVKALVTDEGNVTCHAAIIARELSIPCIVNTGSGTSIFRDGDMVEVDANKGIVRKIRK